jgi:hypothetical protein
MALRGLISGNALLLLNEKPVLSPSTFENIYDQDTYKKEFSSCFFMEVKCSTFEGMT